MTAFLIFRLYGPLAAWGDIAVGERRAGFSRPSKSAVLGLVAAALGVKRTDKERQDQLSEGYGFAVRVDAPGQLMRDYHTAQTARQTDIKKLLKADPRPLTRKRLLSVPDPETILSQRDYLADAHATVALWPRTNAPHGLAAIRDAMLVPKFTLYLGRKSCPLALPLAPDVIEADDLIKALDSYAPPLIDCFNTARLNRLGHVPVLAWEDDVAPMAALHQEQRRDSVRDRTRWLFAERQEKVASLVERGT
ncbi:MAG: type I-E CRISPR-associated protein Cas5/CasD [Rhodospirillales bacterium]|nr:MAG: type I-E CRISPR-associated protein Cas5/CasD [Rhodospirillales bacterium]